MDTLRWFVCWINFIPFWIIIIRLWEFSKTLRLRLSTLDFPTWLWIDATKTISGSLLYIQRIKQLLTIISCQKYYINKQNPPDLENDVKPVNKYRENEKNYIDELNNKTGRLVVYGHSNCIDVSHRTRTIFPLRPCFPWSS